MKKIYWIKQDGTYHTEDLPEGEDAVFFILNLLSQNKIPNEWQLLGIDITI